MSRPVRRFREKRSLRLPDGGFTLLELVLVLFVIAMASLIVYPDLQPMLDGTRLRSSLKRTAAFLDGIRTRAVVTNSTIVVTLGEDRRTLMAALEHPEGGSDDGSLSTADITGVVENITVEPERIRYFPEGSSSGGDITFFKGDAAVGVITVGSFTGLARIIEDEGR